MPTTRSPGGRRDHGTASEESGSTASAPESTTARQGGRSGRGAGAKKATSAKKAASKKTATGGSAAKKAPVKKGAAKKSAAKKAATKKSAAKKTKKSAAKKSAAKKSTAKKAAAKKAVAKKSSGKKASAEKGAARKSSSKKSAAKKSSAKKAPIKKAAAKKSAAKKATAKKAAVNNSSTARTAARKSAKKRSAKHTPTTITRRVSRKRPARRSNANRPLIGWREWVVLPEFTTTPIKAKVDSGAVTSSLHAFNLQISTDGGRTMARFGVAPKQGSHAAKTTVEHPIVGFKKVRSSNGQAELRPVIRTIAVIGEKTFEIDITLASRDAMGFRMLLGRRAVRNRFVIDPGRSFLQPAAADGDRLAGQ